jgi:hypothetical protein
MQQEPTYNKGLDQGFNLDSYRDLLQQLEISKLNQQRLDKKIPATEQLQQYDLLS